MLETNIQPSETIMSREEPSIIEVNEEDPDPQPTYKHERGRKPKKPKRDRSNNIPHLPEFVLDGWKSTFKVQEYNGLKDRHLLGHFYNKRIRKHLQKNHLLSKNDQVIEGKTCLTDFEIQRQNHLSEDMNYRPTRKGAILLGVKLPKIQQFPRLENKIHKNRSTSVTQANSQMYDISSNRLMSITPTQDISTTTNLHDTSSHDNSFSNINTPLTNHNYSSLREQKEVLSVLPEKSSRKKKHSLPKKLEKLEKSILSTKILKEQELEPMSKEDLKAAFSKYKTRLSQTVIVDESPELSQSQAVSQASVTLKEGSLAPKIDQYNSAPGGGNSSERKIRKSDSKESQKQVIVVVESTKKLKPKAERSGSLSPRVVQRSSNIRVSQSPRLKASNTLEPLPLGRSARKKNENSKQLNNSMTRQASKQKESPSIQPLKKQETQSDKSKETERSKKSTSVPPNKSVIHMHIEQANVQNARKDLTQSVLRQSDNHPSPLRSTGSPRKERTSSLEAQKEGSRSPKKELKQSGLSQSVVVNPREEKEKSSPRKNNNSPRKDAPQSSVRAKTSTDETMRTSKEDVKKSIEKKVGKPYETSLPTIKAQKETSVKREAGSVSSSIQRDHRKSPDLKPQSSIKDSQELRKSTVQQAGRKIQMVKTLNQSFEANKKDANTKKEVLNQTVDIEMSKEKEVLEQVNPALLGLMLFNSKPFDASFKQKIQEALLKQKSVSKPVTPRGNSKVNEKDTKLKTRQNTLKNKESLKAT